jgi:peptidoglycan/LPS O-acetylase OafA/YrhL
MKDDSISRKQNDAIQGLRGIAALLVVITHSILTLIERAHYSPADAELAYRLGELGVKMFFVISGFIMTATMYKSFARPGAPMTFVWRRLVRIVPVYWLVTLLYASKLTLTGNPPQLSELLLSLFFIPYDHGQAMFGAPLYALGWTLNYEMFFYMLFTLALLLPRKLGLSFLLAILVALVATRRSVGLNSCPGALCAIKVVYTQPIILYFAAGICLAIMRKWLEVRDSGAFIATNTAIAISLVVALVYGIFVSIGLAPQNSNVSTIAQILACGIATTVCTLEYSSVHRSGRIRGLLLALGNASYSIYLTHSFLMGPAGRMLSLISPKAEGPAFAGLFVFLMLISASILGMVSYRLVERPTLEFLRTRLAPRRTAIA